MSLGRTRCSAALATLGMHGRSYPGVDGRRKAHGRDSRRRSATSGVGWKGKPALLALQRLPLDEAPPSFLVNDVVLGELVWVLESVYEFRAPDISKALRSLLDNASIAFESSKVVASALAIHERTNTGFADCLIAAKNQAAGCAFTATFDRSMRELPAVKVL